MLLLLLLLLLRLVLLLLVGSAAARGARAQHAATTRCRPKLLAARDFDALAHLFLHLDAQLSLSRLLPDAAC